MSTLDELHERWSRDPGYREAYERLGPEFELVRALIEARRRAGMSQAELAARMETTQSAVARLSGRPDSEVDTSDIPELSDSELAGAKRGGLYRPVKKQITARVDADVLAWLKSGGKGYQSRMNAILRQAMLNTK